jgi:EEF1A lysine methyltransferase 4
MTEDEPTVVESEYDDINSRFNKKGYWDERFATEEKYDWLVELEHVSHELLPLLSVSDRILIVGCGNSTFSRDIYNAGFHNITNIDYSAVVIEKMCALHSASCPVMKWIEMDMTALTFADGSFDVIIDKAAMDAIVVEEGDVWDPETEVIETIHKVCSEMARVLKPSKKAIQISFAQPHFRSKYLMGSHYSKANISPYETHLGHSDVYNWDLTYKIVNKGAGSLDTFFYIMTTSAVQGFL